MFCANVLISLDRYSSNITRRTFVRNFERILPEHLPKVLRTFHVSWVGNVIGRYDAKITTILLNFSVSKPLYQSTIPFYCILKMLANHQSKHQNSIEVHSINVHTWKLFSCSFVIVSPLLPDKAVPIKPCWMVNTFGSGYKAQNILQCQCSLSRLVQT